MENETGESPYLSENSQLYKVLPVEKEKIQYRGNVSVSNSDDVAALFSFLQNKAVEFFLAVHVRKDNSFAVQLLSQGGIDATLVDQNLLLAGVKTFNPDTVFLVHNHPSGSLSPSKEDVNLTMKIHRTLQHSNVKVLKHIIVDTYLNQYTIFDLMNGTFNSQILDMPASGKNNVVPMVAFENFEMNKTIAPFIIENSDDVFLYIQNLRFADGAKTGVLLIDLNCSIIGAYIFPNQLQPKDLISMIGENPLCRGIIFFSNDENLLRRLNGNNKEILSRINISILDAIHIQTNALQQMEYTSYASKYFNQVNEKVKTAKKKKRGFRM